MPRATNSITALVLTASLGGTAQSEGTNAEPLPIQARLAKFVPIEIKADLSSLPYSELRALPHLIEAARAMHSIFIRQSFSGNAELERTLTGELGEMFWIHRGLWDRLDEQPFLGTSHRPAGANFYPEDMTKEEFEGLIARHPDLAPTMTGLFTMIRRDPRGNLIAIPYSTYFKEWLAPAARELRLAAAETANETLRRFLLSRAAAFLSDDYYQTDVDWMDLDSLLEITIGPYETYEDGMFGYKAAYEAFVTISDPAASERLAIYKHELPGMEQNLPIPDSMKTERGAESPIRVVDVLFTSGDTRTAVQTIAYNLPNDEKVRSEKGSKKVLLRNVIEAKYDAILVPIAEVLVREDQRAYLSARAFSDQTLFHELSHGIGPGKIVKDGRETEVRLELRELYSPLEEAKADIMGVYNMLFMMERGLISKDLKREAFCTWLAGLFRSIRFGTEEAHGKANAIQFNYMIANGAVVRDADGKYAVDFDRFEGGCEDLVRDICLLQGRGDYEGTAEFFGKYAHLSETMIADLARLGDIPVDIRPIYPFDR